MHESISSWIQEHPRQALVAIGVLGLSLFVGLLILLATFGPNSKSIGQSALTSTTSTPASTTTPFGAVTTTTMSPEQVQNPESSTLSVEQLAARFSLANSQLDPLTYREITEDASQFAKIDSTGADSGKFAPYYEKNHLQPTKWMNDFVVQYAWAQKSGEGILATVWFSGTQIDGEIIGQAAHTIYFGPTADKHYAVAFPPPDLRLRVGVSRMG